MIEAGKLNHRIEFIKNTPVPNSFGELADSWASAGSVWAGVITTGGGEFYAAQRLNSETEAVYTVRYSSITAAVDTKMRVVDSGTTYEILSLNDVNGAHLMLKISVKAVS